ncbi:uncharacterized protein LOC109717629 [Ananas comosus]|uniref:Uncharacterized protein LOC109717629 n=1 Tax=Ananas comosus TaxID=4615 RepID=A0A199VPD8_ANACO|nr:uncharacterized protein LOC109717629 [Ananas comosus]OAY78570.1 hypothetical protein ACMD2_21731 [Ananas comosus]
MGSIVGSLIAGFTKVIGDLFGAPLDFLSGKSCSSVCAATWDLICYIENFCVANLVKMVAVLVLLYIVLLFIYLLYKIGICGCISKGMCKMLWSCIVSCFSSCEYVSMLAWFKLKNLKQSREERKRYLEDYYDTSSDDDLEERISYSRVPRSTELRRTLSKRSRDRRRIYLDRSLRPRSHRIRVGISRRSIYMNENDQGLKHHHGHVSSALHNIKVTHTSRFVQKANVKRIHHRRY